MNKINDLLKNTILFAVGNFGSKILIFLLVPIYTHYMNPHSYGTADLIQNTLNLILPIFSLDIAMAVFRFCMQKNISKNQLITISLYINGFSFIILLVICLFVKHIKLFSSINNYLLLFSIMYLTTSIRYSFQEYCRANDNIKFYVVDSLIYSVILLITTYLFIVLLRLNINGFLLSFIVSCIVSILFLSFCCKIFSNIHNILNVDKMILYDMLKYSIPLIPNEISWWFTNVVGRYVLVFFYSVSLSGIYSVSYKIPSIISVVVSVFMRAWEMLTIKDFENDEKDISFYQNTFKVLIFLSTIFSAILIFFSKDICLILYGKAFKDSWFYMPFLIIALCCGNYQSFLGSFYIALKETKKTFKTTIIGACTNIIFCIPLIYLFGGFGAAISLLLSYFVIFILRTRDAFDLVGFKTPIKEILSYLILLFIESIFVLNGNLILSVLTLFIICLILIICNKGLIACLKMKYFK